ncbi:MAG: HIT family protein [bacterium]
MECIFCKIIKNEIPSQLVYEDDYTMAFLDIAPVLPGHVLVVPKKHVTTLGAMDDVILCHTMNTVQKIAEAMKEALGAKGYNITINNGEAAGQLIDHFHLHVIPRHKKEELDLWAQGKYGAGEAESLAKKIKAKL